MLFSFVLQTETFLPLVGHTIILTLLAVEVFWARAVQEVVIRAKTKASRKSHCSPLNPAKTHIKRRVWGIPYSGKIWRGLKFGNLASSLKLVKFNSSPNFLPFYTLLAAIAATIPGCSVSYDTAQIPEEDRT